MAFQIQNLSKLLDLGGRVPTSAGVIGIDIGSSALKVVQLSMGKDGAALETYGELQLGPYGKTEIGSPVSLDSSTLSAALSDIVREASVSARTAALAVPHASSFITVAPFPTANPAELPSMVPIEARKYVPMAMNEITLDWFVIPDEVKKGETPTSTRVLMAAIHNESLKGLRTVVQNAGIAITTSEIEPFSVIRSSVHEGDTSVMLIDFGAQSTKTYCIEHGILEETHRIPSGGNDITKAIASALSLPYAEAEGEKRVGNGLREIGPLSDAIVPIVDRILVDVSRSMERFERERGTQISRVIIAGGGALLPGLIERLSTVLGRDIHVADPFAKVEHPVFLEETLKEAGPSFSVAVGVALRAFVG